jgi:hypothetical protein
MNKQRERATVEAFLRSMYSTTSSIYEWDRERPDALVQIGGVLVGIEITTVTEALPRQATAPQKWASEAVCVVRAAQELFERRDSSALVVRFELRPSWRPPRRANMARLADELASIADQAIARPPSSVRPGEPITLRDPHRVSVTFVDHWRLVATPKGFPRAVLAQEQRPQATHGLCTLFPPPHAGSFEPLPHHPLAR